MIQQAQQLLAKLAAEGFYGTVSFQFKGGQVVLVRKEETILPSEALRKSNGKTSYEPTER
jgi:hypothetical protein